MTKERKFKVGDVVRQQGSYDQKILHIGVDNYFTEMMYSDGRRTNHSISYFHEKDWSLKPKEVLITRDILAAAWDKSLPDLAYYVKSENSLAFKVLCSELGV